MLATTKPVKQTLYRHLDAITETCYLSAWKLFDRMLIDTGRHTMPSTLLQYCRDYADIAGAVFECVDVARSLYRFTPGVKIAGCLGYGRE